ncbi:MAG: BadF/BadG/BcrA/BcrD ATPase family protein [Ktedonobacterales bacterium]
MHCVLAVDGGNTKTIALVAGLDGAILGVGRGGCSDIYNAIAEDGVSDPALVALANLERAVMSALRSADATPGDLLVSIFNMAGADWPEDVAFWQDEMALRGLGRNIIAQNDALGILYALSPEAYGVSVVCGTGAATGARSQDGRVWHSSFWQDEAQGSSHLGQKTLFAIYRSELGLDPPTSLTGRVLKYFAVDSVEEVLHLFHNRLHRPPLTVHQLTPILLDEAEAGDEVALRVVAEHGALLGDIAVVAATKVGIEHTSYPLVLAGGVFRHPTAVLEQAIVERVRRASPGVQPRRSEHEPIVGVLLEALAVAGATIDQPLLERLLPSLPEGSWQHSLP